MTKDGNKTFIKITNKDIYEKLHEVCEHVKSTNGKVKFNTKAVYVLGVCVLTLTGWFIAFITG